jgi:hypothetical protein
MPNARKDEEDAKRRCHMTDKKIPTVPDFDRLRALAKDAMRCSPQTTASDDADAFSEWLEMAAERLAQAVVESADRSLLIALAESYIDQLGLIRLHLRQPADQGAARQLSGHVAARRRQAADQQGA